MKRHTMALVLAGLVALVETMFFACGGGDDGEPGNGGGDTQTAADSNEIEDAGTQETGGCTGTITEASGSNVDTTPIDVKESTGQASGFCMNPNANGQASCQFSAMVPLGASMQSFIIDIKKLDAAVAGGDMFSIPVADQGEFHLLGVDISYGESDKNWQGTGGTLNMQELAGKHAKFTVTATMEPKESEYENLATGTFKLDLDCTFDALPNQ
ncbi:MAG: hypothetical protein HY897_06600 [Deltaproteobacteria bacterium]|nr:hypothetical protein [Deltaproteobacteria bacterium]